MVHGDGLEILRYGRWSKDFVEDGNNLKNKDEKKKIQK